MTMTCWGRLTALTVSQVLWNGCLFPLSFLKRGKIRNNRFVVENCTAWWRKRITTNCGIVELRFDSLVFDGFWISRNLALGKASMVGVWPKTEHMKSIAKHSREAVTYLQSLSLSWERYNGNISLSLSWSWAQRCGHWGYLWLMICSW